MRCNPNPLQLRGDPQCRKVAHQFDPEQLLAGLCQTELLAVRSTAKVMDLIASEPGAAGLLAGIGFACGQRIIPPGQGSRVILDGRGVDPHGVQPASEGSRIGMAFPGHVS